MAKKPVHEIRFGYIKVTVWKNQTSSGERFNVNFARIYKNGDHWVESANFGRDDLLLIAKGADLAHTWIHSQNDSGERKGR